ncbi:MAG TPA: hypothetical protein VGL56_11075 [Fimbriimonadaceae bacterium]|jgi:hypothetical protein
MLKKLPLAFQELLKLGFGFYCVTGAIAIFCNWNETGRWATCIVVLMGLVIVLALEALAAGSVLLLLKRSRDNAFKDEGE